MFTFKSTPPCQDALNYKLNFKMSVSLFWFPGWLYKEIRGSSRGNLKLKKRWFVLTHNSVDYYKSSERNALKLGSLVLNSLCSVIVPDERVFKETGKHTHTCMHINSRVYQQTFTSSSDSILYLCAPRLLERERVWS